MIIDKKEKNEIKKYIDRLKEQGQYQLLEEVAVWFGVTRTCLHNYIANFSQPKYPMKQKIVDVLNEKLGLDLVMQDVFKLVPKS